MLTDAWGYPSKPNFRWTQATIAGTNLLRNGDALAVGSPSIPVQDVEQVGMYVNVVQATTAYVIKVVVAQWGSSNQDVVILSSTTTIAGQKRQWNGTNYSTVQNNVVLNLNYKMQWGAFTTDRMIFFPVDAQSMVVAIYSNGAPTAGDDVRVFLSLQRSGKNYQQYSDMGTGP